MIFSPSLHKIIQNSCIQKKFLGWWKWSIHLISIRAVTIHNIESASHSVVSDSLWPHGIVHGILQARILELGAYPFSSRSCRPRNRTGVSCTAGRFFTSWASKEAWTLLLGNRNSPLHPHRARQVSRNHSKTSIKEFCCWQLQVNLVGSEKVGTKGI